MRFKFENIFLKFVFHIYYIVTFYIYFLRLKFDRNISLISAINILDFSKIILEVECSKIFCEPESVSIS